MKTDVKVTILIPCYNGSLFLKRCLDSCINQTYKNLNILIVNDGSTDDSLDIIKQYQKKYQNIECINQSNKGLASTRNVLLDNLKTDYGYFLDVDDWIDNECIKTFVDHLEENTELVVSSCLIEKKKKCIPFYITNKFNKKTDKEYYLRNNTIFAWNILFKKSYFDKYRFNTDGQFFEDAGIMTYVIYKSNNVKFINKPMYHYFVNDSSLSRVKLSKEKIESSFKQLNNFYELLSKEEFNKKLPKCLNDQLAFYHCIIFTYIQYQSELSKKDKKLYKKELKQLEKNNYKIHYPKRYWKFWYFVLYRLYVH